MKSLIIADSNSTHLSIVYLKCPVKKMIVLYVCASTLILVALYLRQLYSRFSRCGVKNFPPLPLVGNFGPVVLRRKFFGDALSELYTAFPGEKFVGNYELLSPVIFVKDIDLIKKIAIENSESFMDHRVFISEECDPYFGRTLFMLRGQKWKDMRSMLSPAFTTVKLKQMIPAMGDVAERTVSFLTSKVEKSGSVLDIDVKDISNRYANDVMASCALEIDVDSFTEPNNELFRMGNKASHFSFKILLKFFGYYSVPYVMKKLNITFLSTDTRDFFRELALSTMKEREKRNTHRPDFLQLLIEGRKVWDDQDLIAQVVLVVIAAYETISTTVSFLLHELAVNPDVQDRLVEEIREHSRTTNGKYDYESIQTMTYLNMVISELLRLWPPAVASDRLCTKDFNLGRPNEKSTQDFIVRVGEDVLIPIMAIHRDPSFFPDPLKFDPERFSEANKSIIQPFTYIPFGLGPRSCIGYRFALHSVKTLVYLILKHMVVVPCERTTIPAQLCPESFTLKLKGGHWVRLKKREE